MAFPELTVQCKIVGHASPSGKVRRLESLRIGNNEMKHRHGAGLVPDQFNQIRAFAAKVANNIRIN